MPKVTFASELATPPVDRKRKECLVYPRVAQIKGESKWKDHDDLYWGKKTLSGERKKTARNKGQSSIASSPTNSILLPLAELALSASKVTTALPRRALHYSANLVLGKRSGMSFVSYDGPTNPPPLSTPSSATGSATSSENVTPTEEYNVQLHLLAVAQN